MALSGFVEFFQKGKTFRPKKRFEPGTLRYSLHKQAQASLSSGINLRSVVQLPQGEDTNDWIAVHVVDFFNRINLIYGTVSEYCTTTSCPTMSGGPKFEYLWADGGKYKKPTPLPAPQYVSLLMDWVEAQINNETLFPVSTDVPFPKSFTSLCRKILTRLFRIFVHVYIHHFDRIVAIGAEPHVNTCYKHFYYFVREFDLVSSKELEPLKEMTSHVCRDYNDPPATSSWPPASRQLAWEDKTMLLLHANIHHLLEDKHPPVLVRFQQRCEVLWVSAANSLFSSMFHLIQVLWVIQICLRETLTGRCHVIWGLEIRVTKNHTQQCSHQRTLTVKQLCS